MCRYYPNIFKAIFFLIILYFVYLWSIYRGLIINNQHTLFLISNQILTTIRSSLFNETLGAWTQSKLNSSHEERGLKAKEDNVNSNDMQPGTFGRRIYRRLNFSGFTPAKRKFIILRHTNHDKDGAIGKYCSNYCNITYDANTLATADLVIIVKYVPRNFTRKHPSQRLAYFTWESPYHLSGMAKARLIQYKFDWITTVYRDSIIPYTFGIYVPFTNVQKEILETNSYLPTRDKNSRNMIVWIVSNNVYIPSGRYSYVEELRKHIPIQIYGTAYGNRTLFCANGNWTVCMTELGSRFKFYLAFENSRCRHYITEKIFDKALLYGIVPVVLGAHPSDYEVLVPPHSYIHVDDFASPKHLADYLYYLDKNDTAYAEYFAWKKHGRIISPTDVPCQYCHLLYELRECSQRNVSCSHLFSTTEHEYLFSVNQYCIGKARWNQN